MSSSCKCYYAALANVPHRFSYRFLLIIKANQSLLCAPLDRNNIGQNLWSGLGCSTKYVFSFVEAKNVTL